MARLLVFTKLEDSLIVELQPTILVTIQLIVAKLIAVIAAVIHFN